jgi:hypothetical protein
MESNLRIYNVRIYHSSREDVMMSATINLGATVPSDGQTVIVSWV